MAFPGQVAQAATTLHHSVAIDPRENDGIYVPVTEDEDGAKTTHPMDVISVISATAWHLPETLVSFRLLSFMSMMSDHRFRD